MGTTKEKQVISQLLRDAILELCSKHSVYGGSVEVDGIICISGYNEGQELVVKVHETLPPEGNTVMMTPASSINNTSSDTLWSRKKIKQENGGVPLNFSDHSIDRVFVDYNNDYAPRKHPLSDNEDGSETLDMSMSSRHLSRSSPVYDNSKQTVDEAIQKALLSNKTASLPGTFHFPKRMPIKNERWSPGQPLPTVPECKACVCTFETFELLSDHNEAVHSVFTCQCCYKTFTSRSNLERHSRLHTGHRPYVCHICDKAFSRKDHLSNHATKHAFKCGTCSKRFVDRKTLATHFTYDHNVVMACVCEYCNKGFSSTESYEEHVKAHPQFHAAASASYSAASQPKKRLFTKKLQCTQCSFTTTAKIQLMKHMLVHAENTRCYTCLSCASMFTDPLEYDEHLFAHCNEMNIFECCICRQIASTLDNLKRHELTHLATDTVSYQLANPSQTEQHEDSRGTGELSHSSSTAAAFHAATNRCAVCSLQFLSYHDLCQHMCELHHYPSMHQPSSSTKALSMDKTSLTVNSRESAASSLLKMEMDGIENSSDIEIVQPESPDDYPKSCDAGFSSEFVITDNPTPVIETSAHNSCNFEIKMQPLRSLLSRSSAVATALATPPARPAERHRRKGSPEKAVDMSLQFVDIQDIMDDASDGFVTSPVSSTPKRKTAEESVSGPGSVPGSGVSPGIGPVTGVSPGIGPVTGASPAGSSSSTCSRLTVDIPPGPQTCSICELVSDSFQDLENHCMLEHNRSPCMFCAKTFAQKANRDRHICLHTGDKPYACPECGEKFARGDKLKNHRIRTHNTPYPSPAGVKKESTAGAKDLTLRASPSADQDNAGGSTSLSTNQDNGDATPLSVVYQWPKPLNDPTVNHQSGSSSIVVCTGEWTMVNEEQDELGTETEECRLELDAKRCSPVTSETATPECHP